jgi:hypothetical protein
MEEEAARKEAARKEEAARKDAARKEEEAAKKEGPEAKKGMSSTRSEQMQKDLNSLSAEMYSLKIKNMYVLRFQLLVVVNYVRTLKYPLCVCLGLQWWRPLRRLMS